jgi:anti-sigma regulatory factor (Ser/Thr protein kinase)
VTLVRSMLAALAEALDYEGELLDDLKTAVSEACNNVVLHAYDRAPGPLTVSVASDLAGLDVLVADRGRGLQRISQSADRMGVGLGVISALADRAEFLSPDGGGTEVRMSFTRQNATTPPPGYAAARYRHASVPGVRLSGDVVIWLAPVTITATVLGRLFRAIAATSHFSLDRFADLFGVSDAIATYAQAVCAGEPIGFSISASSRRLELMGGPLPFASGPDADAQRQTLAELVDELELLERDGSRLVRLVFVDRRERSRRVP